MAQVELYDDPVSFGIGVVQQKLSALADGITDAAAKGMDVAANALSGAADAASGALDAAAGAADQAPALFIDLGVSLL